MIMSDIFDEMAGFAESMKELGEANEEYTDSLGEPVSFQEQERIRRRRNAAIAAALTLWGLLIKEQESSDLDPG